MDSVQGVGGGETEVDEGGAPVPVLLLQTIEATTLS